MLGAIIGDVTGSRYEFKGKPNNINFKLFTTKNTFTDDTVMTIAVAEALINCKSINEKEIKENLINFMVYWGYEYKNAGYGGGFANWLFNDKEHVPYNSYGNGSAMRVAAVGWLYSDIETTRKVARYTAEITHNHPEGIKGAEAVASAIYFARIGKTKQEIKNYIETEFSYNLSRNYDEIRKHYKYDVSCQGSVPESIICFLNGNNFEEVIRNAINLGGDTDTMAAIAGSIAEAYYSIPFLMKIKVKKYIPKPFITVLKDFKKEIKDGEKYAGRKNIKSCNEYEHK